MAITSRPKLALSATTAILGLSAAPAVTQPQWLSAGRPKAKR